MKGLLKYLLLLAFAASAGPATAALWQWSTTPATNTTVDPSVNWSLGMAPSAVGPSMRAMMSRTAEWRDDISGSLLTAGSSTAYSVTTNQAAAGNGVCGVGTVPTDGQMIAVTAHVANGASPVIAVDGCAAAGICTNASVAVAPGVLSALTPYALKYSVSSVCWVLHNVYGNPFALPLGAMMPYTGTTLPSANYVFPAGQCLSTTTYSVYWVALGSPGVGGCSAGNFPVIDLRGRALAALDNLNGSAASILTSAAGGCGTAFTSVGATCANGAETISLPLAQIPTGITFANTQSISVNGQAGNTFLFDGSMLVGGTSCGSCATQPSGGGFFSTYSMTGSNSISGTSNNTSGAAVPKVQPTIGVNYILRVL